MLKKPTKIFCFASALAGLMLIGIGAFLLAASSITEFVKIGFIAPGIFLLVLGCSGRHPDR